MRHPFAFLLPALRLLMLLATALPAATQAALIEEQYRIPVNVTNRFGRSFEREIVVTVFRDSTVARAPWLLLNHGRAGTAAERAAMGRARYSTVSPWFVRQGHVVIVPTRLGYGVSGGEDVEESGACNSRDFLPGFLAAAAQSRQVLAWLARFDWLDATRGIAVGQSYGGATTLAIAAGDFPGLRGGFNFAGGSGGDPVRTPEQPCSPERLQKVYEGFGKASRAPVEWFYSANDKYWGTSLPQRWFAAWREAGGKGSFNPLPAYRNDGHGIFSGEPTAWMPLVEKMLADTRAP